MNLYVIPIVLAMGDPNFLPGNPPNAQYSELERMSQTTADLNKIHQDPEEKQQRQQEQLDREYNRNEPDQTLKMDDIFKEATKPTKSKEGP